MLVKTVPTDRVELEWRKQNYTKMSEMDGMNT